MESIIGALERRVLADPAGDCPETKILKPFTKRQLKVVRKCSTPPPKR